VVDHIKGTMDIRGILHSACNHNLGRVGDSEEAFRQLLAYGQHSRWFTSRSLER
jgi:hypothetical protein